MRSGPCSTSARCRSSLVATAACCSAGHGQVPVALARRSPWLQRQAPAGTDGDNRLLTGAVVAAAVQRLTRRDRDRLHGRVGVAFVANASANPLREERRGQRRLSGRRRRAFWPPSMDPRAGFAVPGLSPIRCDLWIWRRAQGCTPECELIGDDIGGMAANVGARIGALAGADGWTT
jgi:hypothetical protein